MIASWTEGGVLSVQTNILALKRQLSWLIYGEAYHPTVGDEYLVVRSDKFNKEITGLINRFKQV